MEKVIFDRLPHGLSTAAGGTRRGVRRSRPWQSDIVVDPTTCPFCTREQKEVARFEDDGGWRVIENIFTPFPFHVLILPMVCWEKEKLRVLGGVPMIAAALRIVTATIGYDRWQDLWLGVHIGALAGQNIFHLHYHLLASIDEKVSFIAPHEISGLKERAGRVVFRDREFTVAAGGLRAGQCFILPETEGMVLSEKRITNLAETLDQLIALCSEKFRSNEGLPPDYQIGFRFAHFTGLLYGYYLPILNQWGFTEYFGLMEKTPLILPWPHEETVEYLRG